jgi:hypothetical protein
MQIRNGLALRLEIISDLRYLQIYIIQRAHNHQ